VARQIIDADSEVEKEYLVRIPGSAEPEQIEKLRSGTLELDGKKLKPVQVDWIHENQLRMVLREGRKRQIRRMAELVGLKVVGLKRVRVGKIRLGKLPEGQWRYLAPDESFV
jgi:23S rRNA pseudouridine2604 synthase